MRTHTERFSAVCSANNPTDQPSPLMEPMTVKASRSSADMENRPLMEVS